MTHARRRRPSLRFPGVTAVLFSEDALAGTASLWAAALRHLARKLGRVRPLDAEQLPVERAAAITAMEVWAGGDVTTWRRELARFYEEHIPLYLRPDAELNGAVRRLARAGVALGAWSPGPAEAAAVVTHFLGLGRRLERQIVDGSAHAPVALARELGYPPDELATVLVVTPQADARAVAPVHSGTAARIPAARATARASTCGVTTSTVATSSGG